MNSDETKLVLENQNTHIYLYAKNWYKKGNIIDDLSIIFSHRSGIEKQYISKTDIIIVLSNIVSFHMQQGDFKRNFLDFINDLSPHSSWKFNEQNGIKEPKYDFYDQLIKKCLLVIGFTSIDNIPGRLGNPDKNILPLSKNKNLKI